MDFVKALALSSIRADNALLISPYVIILNPIGLAERLLDVDSYCVLPDGTIVDESNGEEFLKAAEFSLDNFPSV